MNRRLLSVAALSVLLTGFSNRAHGQPIIPGYSDYKTFAAQVAELGRRPGVAVAPLAKTLGGREVLLLTIGHGEPNKKPAILIVGAVEPGQVVGSEVAMRLARKLAAGDEGSNKLLDRFTFYIIPRPSPDASERFFIKPYLNSGTNLRPTDDDNDGRMNEDPPEDIDGDGIIAMMRVLDPAGDYIEHPADKRVLIRADPRKSERGKYKLYSEGIDNDHDEQWNEDGPGGVNFNRNWTFNYLFFTPGSGPHQVSEIETRAVADFCFAHDNIAAICCFGPQDNLNHPWKPEQGGDGRARTSVQPEDAPVLERIAEKHTKLTGAKDAPPSAPGSGAFLHWAYFHYGRWAIGARAWWVPKVEEPKKDEEKKTDEEKKEEPKGGKRGGPKGPPQPATGDGREAEMLNALKWFKQQNMDAFVDWHPFNHPDFPGKTVEIGGIKPFVMDNPPADRLDAIADGEFKFLGEFVGMMPRVTIADVKVEPLGGDVYRITATASNEGAMPTASQMGHATREPHRLQWHLDGPPDTTFIIGHKREQIERLAGNGGRDEFSWLIRTPAESIRLTIESPSVGSASKSVKLK